MYLALADAPPARTDAVVALDSPAMGPLIFSLNLTLDGCVDHQEGIADDETHAFFTRLMDEGGAMLWGRVTYEMMESYWPAVARGDEEARPPLPTEAEDVPLRDRSRCGQSRPISDASSRLGQGGACVVAARMAW